MNKYNPSELDEEIWKALYGLLWGEEILGLEAGASLDGISPERIETNKEGIDIAGSCWLLRGAEKSDYEFKMSYRLLRPRFSSLQNVTKERIEKSKIRKFEAQEDWVEIEIN